MNPYDEEELVYTPSEPQTPFEDEEDSPYAAQAPDDFEDRPVASEQILEVAQTLVAHGELLAEHDSSIKFLLDKFKKESQDKPVFWSWRYATGEARGELWEIINDFVYWINHRYFVDMRSKQILPCWYLHGAIVEELTGLWAAWWDASYNAKKPNTKMAEYHRRYFWPTMEQIWVLSSECHKKNQHSIAATSGVRPDNPGMRDYILEDVQTSMNQTL